MPKVRRLVLDVLKAHEPSALEFARALAEHGDRVSLKIVERDERTETTEIIVDGDDIDLAWLSDTISRLGGSLHSVDEVIVEGHVPQKSKRE